MMKLWFFFALELTVVNTLSLAKSTGQMVASYTVKTKRKVQLIFIKFLQLTNYRTVATGRKLSMGITFNLPKMKPTWISTN